MLLTLTSTADDATRLGFLLHKHPERVQRFDLPVGAAHVFYPEATPQRCTVALLLEVDPVGLVRGRRFGGDAFALAQYVNDRPYAASSMLAVALGKVFATAMKGRCDSDPELAQSALPLTVHLPCLPAAGPEDVEHVFGPLGWRVDARRGPLDATVPAWGPSPYVDVTLTGTMRLADALSHLYVLLPVLDGAKHYWVGPDEVDKLIRAGGSWLAGHPLREQISSRYLAHQRRYVADATARLAELDDAPAPPPQEEPAVARSPLRLARTEAILAVLRELGAAHVVDLGCGEGALVAALLAEPRFTRVVGVDVSARELARAERRLGVERMPDQVRGRLTLRQSSATYRDAGLAGADAVVLAEVIEHLDVDRLPALQRAVFGYARPGAVVVTTPNADHNVRYPGLAAGGFRHPDHRFEFSRSQFAAWARTVADKHGYEVQLRPVGDDDPQVGPPTQMAVFVRCQGSR